VIQRITVVALAAFAVLIFALVHAQESHQPASIPEALIGLRSRDIETFAVSCETFKSIYSESVDELLRIAKDPDQAGDEARVRKAIETLAALKYDKAIPLCVQRVDYVQALVVDFGHDPILKNRPFARALADYGQHGVDAVLEFLVDGNTTRESEHRLALFAHILSAAYVLDRQHETLQDYTIRYGRGKSTPSLEKVLQYLRLDPSELARIIDTRRDGKTARQNSEK